MITLTIDGKEIRTEEGKTILEVARENGVSIPTLCYHENLLPIGSCRLCIVEVDGYEKPVASCTTTATDGISVTTQSERLFRMRQAYLKLLLIHHPLECPICDAGGECHLQDLAFAHKIERVDLTAEKKPIQPAAYATPLIRYSEGRCVLCLRCIHACREVSGRTVLSLEASGIEARMTPANSADCISCGECLFVCPVGALTERLSPVKSRKWQTERRQTTCPHCGFGCSLTLDVYEDRFITKVISNQKKLPNRGSLCVMGRFGYDFANHEHRIKTASVREGEGFRECNLTEAVEATAEALTKLRGEGKGIGFILSPRATNEELYMISQIAGFFPVSPIGTTGYYHTGRVLEAYRQMGISYPYDYEKIMDCDLVVVAGADLLVNNHLLANKVREAVKTRGAKVAVIDPAPAPLTRIADVWLKVKPGEDNVLFSLTAKQLLAERSYDPDAEGFGGFAEFIAGLEKFEKQGGVEQCGIDNDGFDKFCKLFSKTDNVAVIFGSGISTDERSMAALLDLCLFKGLHKKGLIMPVSLQSNAVGAVSILPDVCSPDEVLSNAGVNGLFVYEDDPFHYLSVDTVEGSLKGKDFITVCDALPTDTANFAHVIVPTGTFVGKEGNFIAEDGFTRTVGRARGSASAGFEFLRMLLQRLGGGLYKDEKEAGLGLSTKGITETDGIGGERLVPANGPACFYTPQDRVERDTKKPFILVLRNALLNHHLCKDEYSKGIDRAFDSTPPIAGDRLLISVEDASTLGVTDGDSVILESDYGTATCPVSVKAGLKKGVVQYMMFKNRRDILRLGGYRKHIEVTARKG